MDSDNIVALIAILAAFSIPVFWLYFDHKAKERRAKVLEKALEVGTPPEDVMHALQDGSCRRRHRIPYRKGLVLLAIGGAMLCAAKIGLGQGDDGLPLVGLILSFLGVAFLLSDFFNRNQADDSSSRP